MTTSIKMNLTLCDRDIENIVDIALDGKIGNLCDKVEKFAHKSLCGQIHHIWKLRLRNANGKFLCLTEKKFICGLKKYLQNQKKMYSDFLEVIDHELRVDTECVDADVADAIIQYALAII